MVRIRSQKSEVRSQNEILPLLRLENVAAGYGDRIVLSNISLSVNEGECVGIVGPNGSGKTTLLKIMTGALKPLSGRVKFQDRDLSEWLPKERARRMAVVPQEHEGMTMMRVREVVMAGRTPYLSWFGWESSQDEQVVEKVMTHMQIQTLSERWMHTLSSGERQRVWMALALAQEPRMVFLDEPTSHLDFKFQIDVMEQAAALQQTGVAVVWVSHDLNLAVRFCTRMVALSQGAVVAEGSPAQVVTPSIIEAVYGKGVGVEQAQDGFPAVLPRRCSLARRMFAALIWGGLAISGFADVVGYGPLGGHFYNPSAVVVMSSAVTGHVGDIVVADTVHHRIQVFSSNGVFRFKFGAFGTRNGQFNNPSGVAVQVTGSTAQIYVADTNNHRIQVFDQDGAFVRSFGTGQSSPTVGRFNTPVGVFVAGSTLYVAEASSNNRIQIYNGSSWSAITQATGLGVLDAPLNAPRAVAFDTAGNNLYIVDTGNNRIVRKDGGNNWTQTTGFSVFNFPAGIAVSASATLIVVGDAGNNRLQVASGPAITGFAPLNISSTQVGALSFPLGVAFDASLNLFVADTGFQRIDKFTSAGADPSPLPFGGGTSDNLGSFGIGGGLLQQPLGVAVDETGNLYMADTFNGRVQKFHAAGSTFTADFPGGLAWGGNPSGVSAVGTTLVIGVPYGPTQSSLVVLNASGAILSGLTMTGQVAGLVLGFNRRIYAADVANGRVLELSLDGTVFDEIGGPGSGDGQLSLPQGVAVDALGNVFVADSQNHRIQIFNNLPSHNFLGKFGTRGSASDQFELPAGIVVEGSYPTGYIYVSDTGNHRIQVFTMTGAYVTTVGSYGGPNASFAASSNTLTSFYAGNEGSFASPGLLAIHGSTLLVADTLNYRIQRLAGSSVGGQIKDDQGQVLSGVSVQAINAQGIVTQSTATDSGGNYQFSRLSTGTYTIKASLTGKYAPLSQTVVVAVGKAVSGANFAPSAASQTAVSTFFHYPNPVRGNSVVTFRFSANVDVDVTIEVFNVAGERMAAIMSTGAGGRSDNEITWDASNLDRGVYLYRMEARSSVLGSVKTGFNKLVIIR